MYRVPSTPENEAIPPSVDLRAHLDAFRPDLIHVFNPFSLGIVGLRQAHRLEVPSSPHTTPACPRLRQRWGMGVLRSPPWAYVRWLHSQADLNLCPSRTTLARSGGTGHSRVKIWTRGVDRAFILLDARRNGGAPYPK
ncbi:MAG: glycosyltransferase [Anaerolineae bacterium]